MSLAELLKAASPPCHECGFPVLRVEIPWERTPGGEWVPDRPTMVCSEGHRVLVEPLP